MILFNGQEFPSMKAFKRAFPIYASYADAVRDGADTVLKLETVINQRRTNVRESQKTGHAHLREIHKGGFRYGAG